MAVFEGAGVALVTPFHEDLSINYEKMEELIEEQIAGGTDAIIAVGTTGEASTLSHEEHIDAIRHACQIVKGRVPVVVGTGSNCTDTAIYLSVEAQRCGADAVLQVTPYYNKATQKGLIRHFGAVADAITLPVILYNVPSRTGVTIQPETVAELVKTHENIVGIKEASGDFTKILRTLELVDGPDNIEIYSGNDDQIVPVMSLGGKGVISVLSNVAPAETHAICQAMKDGDVKKAAAEQIRAAELIRQLFIEVNPIPVKAALNLMGKEVGPYRGPLCEMEEEHLKSLKAAMKEYGIL